MPTDALRPKTEEQRLVQLSRALEALQREIESDLGPSDLAHLERICTLSRRLELLGRGMLHFSFEPLGFSAGVLTLWVHKCLEQMEIGHASLARPHAAYASDHEVGPSMWGATMRALDWLGLVTSLDLHRAEAVDTFTRHAQKSGSPADAPRPLHHQVHESALGYLARAALSFPALGKTLFWKVALGNLLSELARDAFAGAMTQAGRIVRNSAQPSSSLEGQADRHLRQLQSARDLEVPLAMSILCGALDKRIEHHLFPLLPPNRLRQLAPRVRDLCREHGVSYRSVGLREAVRGLFSGARPRDRACDDDAPAAPMRAAPFTAAAARAR
ncbi:MAG: putative LINOLEOYL-CoA [Myxococcaceae bacterium]|nr:putative LINOLEOYL-CoA [Myxococcaceae bacterium]